MANLRDELLAIRAAEGRLTPHLVVEAARPSDSVLHSRFEWDDVVAGEAYREQQARELIRSVRVKYAPSDEGAFNSVRAFHAVRTPDGSRSYENVDDVVANPIMTRLLLLDMERDWRSLRARWEDFHEFWELVGTEALDKVV